MPAELQEERCGVLAYHHPAILEALRELSPEGQLAALIDAAARAGGIQLPWTGTAADLKSLLMTGGTARDAEKLLGGWAPAAGTYLGRLEGCGRVERLTLRDGIQRWKVLSSGAVE